MLRDVAVTRIQDGLGFATRQSDKIILRLQEAQRELEMGKTLPKFLLQEDSSLNLLTNAITVNLPTGFLRVDDDYEPFYFTSEFTPVSIALYRGSDFTRVFNSIWTDDTPVAPKAMVVRNTTVNFITVSDADYTIFWQYYKAAAALTTNIENEWLANAPEWLIGEAGWRMAMDARDKDAIS